MPHPLSRLCRTAVRLLPALIVCALTSRGKEHTSYDLVIPVTPPSEPLTVDGKDRALPTDRSFVIGIDGGPRGSIVFTNWVAPNPAHPVIIVNRHGTGQVIIEDDGVNFHDGIRFERCAFVKLLGNNDPAFTHGIEVARAGRVPSPGVSRVSRIGVNVATLSTAIEIGWIEVHHTGFAGIMAKTDPQQNRPEAWAANFTMHDLSIHDCYIHDVGGEGMYIGYTGWSKDHWPEAPGYESHEIVGLRIYNNLIERSMWDGFQYASAPGRDTEVFNNVVVASGLEHHQYQANGVQIGAGASGRFYENIIIDSHGNSLAMFGVGENAIYNNLLIGGENGIFADNRPDPPPSDPEERQTIRGSAYSFYHNTIINPAGHAFWTMSEVTKTHFHNNLSVVPNSDRTDAFVEPDSGATLDAAGNVLFRSLADAGFVDPAHHDYRLRSKAGPVSDWPPTPSDLLGTPRTPAPTPGAFESGPLSLFLLATPPRTADASGTLRASVIGGKPPYTYAWSTGATSDTLTDVPAGRYEVTVTDASGTTRTRATILITGATMGAPTDAKDGERRTENRRRQTEDWVRRAKADD